MSHNVGNFLPSVWPSSKGEAIDSAVHQIAFYGASNDVQLSILQQDMLDIVGYGDGE